MVGASGNSIFGFSKFFITAAALLSNKSRESEKNMMGIWKVSGWIARVLASFPWGGGFRL